MWVKRCVFRTECNATYVTQALIWGSPDRCYKAIGSPPRIPPDAHCLFYVHLIEVKTKAHRTPTTPESVCEDERFTPEECLLRARAHKNEGNALYGQRQFSAALSYYNQGVKLLQLSKVQRDALPEPLRTSYLELTGVLYLNSAAAYMELKEWDKAARHCSSVSFSCVSLT